MKIKKLFTLCFHDDACQKQTVNVAAETLPMAKMIAEQYFRELYGQDVQMIYIACISVDECLDESALNNGLQATAQSARRAGESHR